MSARPGRGKTPDGKHGRQNPKTPSETRLARRRTLGTLARPGWSTSRICDREGVAGRVHGQYRRLFYRFNRRTRDAAASPETSASRKRGRSARRRVMFSSGIRALTNWRRARRRFVMNLRVRRVQEVFDMVATRPTRRRASCRTCRTKGLPGCVIAGEKYPELRLANARDAHFVFLQTAFHTHPISEISRVY